MEEISFLKINLYAVIMKLIRIFINTIVCVFENTNKNFDSIEYKTSKKFVVLHMEIGSMLSSPTFIILQYY